MEHRGTGGRVALIGSGGLARATAYALATTEAGPDVATEVLVLARRASSARQICSIANVRAAIAARAVHFRPVVVDPAAESFAESLAACAPDGVLLCASHQSPWESTHAPSAWTKLLRRAGFGLSIPLQADFAVKVGRAAAACDAWFVNACLPDLVNPLLKELRIPVICGVGNCGILAAALQHALGLPDQHRLALVAHHLHLNAPVDEKDEALVWCDDVPVRDVGNLLSDVRSVERAELNQITGYTVAQVISSLVSGNEFDTNLPGPNGLPGGYPVRIKGREVTLRLPGTISLDDAVAANRAWCRADGAVVEAGRVHFSPRVAKTLAEHASPLTGGFAVADVAQACADLLSLRDSLRQQGSDSNPGGTS